MSINTGNALKSATIGQETLLILSRLARLRLLLFSPLWPLLIALGLRIFLLIHTHGVIDGDEALVGIQAERILRGDFPVYFYGQTYMGSLEAYLIALLFALSGPSVWALRAEPLLLALVVVWLTWKLAEILTETSTLTPTMRRVFMTGAALCAAIPPLYDGVLEGRAYGGFIEMLVVILLILISTLRLARRLFNGATRVEAGCRWAMLGFLLGLGFWIYPLMASAVLAAALWLLGACAWEVWQGRDNRGQAWRKLSSELPPALWSLPGALLGIAPALGWGATHQWTNIAYVFSLGGHETLAQKFSDMLKLTASYATCVGPRVIGGNLPRESAFLTTIHTSLFFIDAICIGITLLGLGFAYARPGSRVSIVRQLAALPTLFALCTIFLFCVSSASKSIFIGGCEADNAGRYAAPLMLALPFFYATAFTLAWTFLTSSAASSGSLESRLASPRWSPALIARLLLVLALLAMLLTSLFTYQQSDAGRTYQSNYCPQAPSDNDPLLRYLQVQHIHYFWATNMLAYPLVFKSHLTVIGADPLPLIHPKIALNRIPSYTDAVLHAEHPSMLFIVHHDEAQPEILQVLQKLRVSYRAARFPSQPGYDVLVVTPLSRSVSPLETPQLDLFYCVSRG